MPRSIDYRATSAHPASKVYAAMVDRDLLEEQLRHIGGPGAGVTAYETTADGVRYTLRHGIPGEHLPSIVSSFVPGGTCRSTAASSGGPATRASTTAPAP